MNQFGTKFEIIEDQGPEPLRKRKQKRKSRPLFNYVPWRLIMITLTAGMSISIAILFFLIQTRPPTSVITTTVIPNIAGPAPAQGVNRSMAPISDIAYFDNDLIAVSSLNVQIFKGEKLVQVLDAPTPRITFSQDGKLLASVQTSDGNGGLQLWDVETGKLLKEAPINEDSMPSSFEGKNIAFSDDARLLAVGTRSEIGIWDVKTLAFQYGIAVNQMGMTALAFSPDNQRLITILDKSDPVTYQVNPAAQIWDIHKPNDPHLLYEILLDGAFAQKAVLSADAHYMAYVLRNQNGVENSQTLYIHNLTAQKVIGSVPVAVGTSVSAMAINDGTLAFEQRGIVAAGDQNSLRVIHWSVNDDGFSYDLSSLAQPIRVLGIAHLRLWTKNGHSGLDYLTLDTSTILRWDFDANTVRPLTI